MKALDLETAWVVELFGKHGKSLLQVLNAENMDKAIESAKNTFQSRLYGFDSVSASGAQKYFPELNIYRPLRFGFCGGWVTVRETGTLAEMYQRAEKKDFVQSKGPITEIFSFEE